MTLPHTQPHAGIQVPPTYPMYNTPASAPYELPPLLREAINHHLLNIRVIWPGSLLSLPHPLRAWVSPWAELMLPSPFQGTHSILPQPPGITRTIWLRCLGQLTISLGLCPTSKMAWKSCNRTRTRLIRTINQNNSMPNNYSSGRSREQDALNISGRSERFAGHPQPGRATANGLPMHAAQYPNIADQAVNQRVVALGIRPPPVRAVGKVRTMFILNLTSTILPMFPITLIFQGIASSALSQWSINRLTGAPSQCHQNASARAGTVLATMASPESTSRGPMSSASLALTVRKSHMTNSIMDSGCPGWWIFWHWRGTPYWRSTCSLISLNLLRMPWTAGSGWPEAPMQRYCALWRKDGWHGPSPTLSRKFGGTVSRGYSSRRRVSATPPSKRVPPAVLNPRSRAIRK